MRCTKMNEMKWKRALFPARIQNEVIMVCLSCIDCLLQVVENAAAAAAALKIITKHETFQSQIVWESVADSNCTRRSVPFTNNSSSGIDLKYFYFNCIFSAWISVSCDGWDNKEWLWLWLSERREAKHWPLVLRCLLKTPETHTGASCSQKANGRTQIMRTTWNTRHEYGVNIRE